MSVALSKGGNISLTKESRGLSTIHVNVGWEVKSRDGSAFLVQIACFLLGQDGRIQEDTDWIFFDHPECMDGAVSYGKKRERDLRDKESITMCFAQIPQRIHHLSVTANIYEARERKQTFGDVRAVFVRVLNADTNEEIVRYELEEDPSSLCTALILAEIYRKDNEWKFKAVGQGFKDGLKPLVESFGLFV